MKGNEWRVLRAKERTCFNVLWTFVEACDPKLISICFIPLFIYLFILCVILCPYWQVQNQLDVILGKKWRSKWQGKESTSLQVTLIPLMTYLSALSSFMVILFFLCSSENGKKKNLGKGKGRKLFKLLALGSMGWRFSFVWKSQMLISFCFFFFPFPTFSWHPNKTSFHFSHMESCFFSHWFCTYQKDITNLVVSFIYF